MRRFLKGLAAMLGVGRRPAPADLAPPHAVPSQPALRPQTRQTPQTGQTPQARQTRQTPQTGHAPAKGHRAARRQLAYAPQLDGQADPGEVVWTWVKYEDDPSQGKDRPVLVVGREGAVLMGLMLSSNSERDGQHNWLALGAGAWDRQDRPSWVRLDRVLEVAEDGIRREGAVLDRTQFDSIARALREGYGWA